jgi:drug/metabolite transporter (DMT)-like permease
VTIALLQLAATMMMVGANVVVGKLLAQALPVPLVLFLRCSIAVAVLAPFAWRAGGLRVSPRLLGNLALQAATGTALYNLSLLAGLRHTGALQAGLVLSTLPATVAVAAFLLLGERLALRRWLAAGLAVAGMAALALGRGGGTGGDGSLLGNALVFGAVLAESAWILLSRLSAARVGLLTGAFWMQTFGLTMLAPFALPDLPAHLADLAQPRLLGLLLFHAMTASVISVILWFSGMRRVPANLAGVFAVLLPATAAALAVLVLGERMTAPLAAGFGLMLGSILLATWPSRRPGPRPS